MRRALVFLALLGAALVLPARPASAHPLGNFTVNQFNGIVVRPGAVDVEVVVDMAEIPAFQTREDIDTDGDGQVSPTEGAAYHERGCRDLTGGLALQVDGRPQRLGVRSGAVSFPPGQAGLPTLRLRCDLEARTGERAGGGPGRVTFANTNFADRVGWREITAAGEGVRLVASDVPVHSPSHRLTRYPDDLLRSPLDQRHATLRVAAGPPAPGGAAVLDPAGGGPSSPLTAPRSVDRLTAAFTGLVARQDLTFGFGVLALAVAVALGALHALAPGHGKTVMAAYLVGQRGSLRQAIGLGLTVTATHTAGVLVLGVLLSGSTTFVPEHLYVWLRLASGTLLAVVGAGLLRRALRRGRHEHHHDHHHDAAGLHDHRHPGPQDGPGVSRRALVAMGAAGGMVPSPSALVVLLGAIALGRTWFGVGLVLAYGVGMAVSLLAAGLLLVRFRGVVDGRLQRSRAKWMVAAARAVPAVAAALVVVAGLGIVAGAVVQA